MKDEVVGTAALEYEHRGGSAMENLQNYYRSHKAAISEALSNSKSPQQFFRRIEAFIADASGVDSEYVRNLTPSQARLALTFLGSLRELFRTIAASFTLPSDMDAERQHVVDDEGNHRGFRLPSVDALTGIGAAGLIGGVLVHPMVAIPAALAAGLAASTATHFLTPSERPQPRRKPSPPSAADVAAAFPFKQAIPVDFLEEMFIAVDDMVAEHGRLEQAARPKEVAARIEDHPVVLALFQDLLGWYARKQSDLQNDSFYPLRLRFEETLPDLLSRYSLSIHPYDSAAPGMDATVFDFEEEVGDQKLQSAQMIQPALMRGDDVVMKGRVILPKHTKGK